MKKALFYTPYFHILGGGEQHLFSMAKCISKTHKIYFATPHPQHVKDGLARFDIKLSRFETVPVFPARVQLRRFDLIFFVSNGSIPFLPISKSILYFMSPFVNVSGRSLLNQAKLKFIDHVIVNSKYAKKHIDQEFNTNSKVIYPAIATGYKPAPKKNIILSVGRFTPALHQKNQQALIKAFIQLEKKLPNYKLVLAGGTEPGSKALIAKLKKQIGKHRAQIKTNISSSKRNLLYSQAKIYWHAAGYNQDLKTFPQKAEHFGISVAEAMSHAVVPLAFNAGGPKEIITPQSGFLWNNTNQLIDITLKLVNNATLLKNTAKKAQERAKFFNSKALCKNLYEMVKK